MVSPRGEELLSYLIGLGPVGTPVRLDHRHVLADLGIRRTTMLGFVAKLITKDLVERCGSSMYVVKDRTILDRPRVKAKRKPQGPRAKKPRVVANVHYEPRDPIWPPKLDRRDLTAFVCGDPLPERSALSRRFPGAPA
jgi:hypothetical protein